MLRRERWRRETTPKQRELGVRGLWLRVLPRRLETPPHSICCCCLKLHWVQSVKCWRMKNNLLNTQSPWPEGKSFYFSANSYGWIKYKPGKYTFKKKTANEIPNPWKTRSSALSVTILPFKWSLQPAPGQSPPSSPPLFFNNRRTFHFMSFSTFKNYHICKPVTDDWPNRPDACQKQPLNMIKTKAICENTFK